MRHIFSILIALVFIAAAALGILFWKICPITERVLSNEFGVTVTVGNIYYKNSTISIDNIVIGSPLGSKSPYALKIDRIRVEAPISSYFQKNIEIKKFAIDTVDMNIEFYNKQHSQGNWNTILANLESSKSGGTHRQATIDLLTLSNLKFKLLQPNDKTPKQLPPLKSLQFENIQTANGDLTNRVAQTIIAHLVQAVFWKYAIDSTLKFPFQAPSDAVNGAFDTLKGIFGN